MCSIRCGLRSTEWRAGAAGRTRHLPAVRHPVRERWRRADLAGRRGSNGRAGVGTAAGSDAAGGSAHGHGRRRGRCAHLNQRHLFPSCYVGPLVKHVPESRGVDSNGVAAAAGQPVRAHGERMFTVPGSAELIRVVRGTRDADELAALLTVLTAISNAADERNSVDCRRRARWDRGVRPYRPPGSWRQGAGAADT
ncbi:acyl-CoA carboxylase subunit epsilon [Streptomyces sp. NPDC001286]